VVPDCLYCGVVPTAEELEEFENRNKPELFIEQNFTA
jgi:hypothetical protein